MLTLTKAPDITQVEVTKNNHPIMAREVPPAVFTQILNAGVNVSATDRQAHMVLIDDGQDRYVITFRVGVETLRALERMLTLALSQQLARGIDLKTHQECVKTDTLCPARPYFQRVCAA